MFIIYLGVFVCNILTQFVWCFVAHSHMHRIKFNVRSSKCDVYKIDEATMPKLNCTESTSAVYACNCIRNKKNKITRAICLKQRTRTHRQIDHVKCLFLLQTCASTRPHSEFLWYRSSAKHKNVVYFMKNRLSLEASNSKWAYVQLPCHPGEKYQHIAVFFLRDNSIGSLSSHQ